MQPADPPALQLRASAAHPTHPSPTPRPGCRAQYGWSPQAQPLVAALGERLRRSMLDLVGRSYSTISPAKLAALLGCSEGEAAAAAGARGWAVAEDGLLEVTAAPPAPGAAEEAAQRSLQRLAEYVVHLEA